MDRHGSDMFQNAEIQARDDDILFLRRTCRLKEDVVLLPNG